MSLARRRAGHRERAHAKLTLSLRVLGTRPDGFHELDALTVAAADVYDDVTITPQPKGITCAVSPGGAAPGGQANLAARAGTALAPLLPPDARAFRIRIRKRLPMGAGLGGGSADAAAVLRGLGRYHGVLRSDLVRLAARLGSDVVFCLDNAPAFMRGRGERVDAIPGPVPPLHLVLVTPAFECATPAVYRAWDELGGPRATRGIEPPGDWARLVPAFANDLEPAAEHVEPRLVPTRERLEEACGRPCLLLGSGSSYALVAADAADAAATADRARAALPDARLVAASPLRA